MFVFLACIILQNNNYKLKVRWKFFNCTVKQIFKIWQFSLHLYQDLKKMLLELKIEPRKYTCCKFVWERESGVLISDSMRRTQCSLVWLVIQRLLVIEWLSCGVRFTHKHCNFKVSNCSFLVISGWIIKKHYRICSKNSFPKPSSFP